MRVYTVLLSVLVHAIAVGFAIVAPILATVELPEPRRATEFVVVRPVAPPEPQRPAEIRSSPPRVSRDVAPVEEPDGVEPEPIEVPPADQFEEPNSAVAGAVMGDPGRVPEMAPPPPPVPAPPVRVGGAIRPPQKIVHVAPEYPEIARASRTRGVVILEAVIGEDGRVRDVRVLRGVALLDDAAIRAVRQWQFTPTLLNGQPVPVVMTVTVAFTLN
jgi:periplasmic protein TonB